MARKRIHEPFWFSTLQAYAIAFFMTYILGNVLMVLGNLTTLTWLYQWGSLMTGLVGVAIGAAVSYKMQSSYLGMISAMMAGCIGMGNIVNTSLQVASPLIAYFCVLLSVFLSRFLDEKTPFDIILLPVLSVFLAGIIKEFISPYVTWILSYVVSAFNYLEMVNPLVMGMGIAILAGIIYTSPLTLVAIGSLFHLSPLGYGASLAGVMSFMLGLGIMSLQDNDMGDSLAVLFGTSMLQFTNLLKHPILLIPPVISSLLCGMLSTSLFHIQTTFYGAFMGGTALIGLMETVNTMGMNYWILPVICDVILPIVFTLSIYQLFKKAGYIHNGDLKIYK